MLNMKEWILWSPHSFQFEELNPLISFTEIRMELLVTYLKKNVSFNVHNFIVEWIFLFCFGNASQIRASLDKMMIHREMLFTLFYLLIRIICFENTISSIENRFEKLFLANEKCDKRNPWLLSVASQPNPYQPSNFDRNVFKCIRFLEQMRSKCGSNYWDAL